MFNVRSIDNAVIVGVDDGSGYKEQAFLFEDTDAVTKAEAFIDTSLQEASLNMATRAKDNVSDQLTKAKTKKDDTKA